MSVRLAIGVVTAAGILAAVWLMGYLGFRLGFAPLIDVPLLEADPGAGLVTGTLVLTSVPKMIILAGESRPGWLMLAFAMIALPGAGLGAVRSRPREGTPAFPAAMAFSYAGAVGAALNALLLVWWTVSPFRTDRIAQLPIQAADAGAWLEGLRSVAGLDVLAVVVAALWVVLALRLAVPLWMRALAGTASLFTLVVATVAMSISNAAVAELERQRSEVFLDDGSHDTKLLLGFTAGHAVLLRAGDGVAVVLLQDRSTPMTVFRRQSIIGMLQEAESRRKLGTSTNFEKMGRP